MRSSPSPRAYTSRGVPCRLGVAFPSCLSLLSFCDEMLRPVRDHPPRRKRYSSPPTCPTAVSTKTQHLQTRQRASVPNFVVIFFFLFAHFMALFLLPSSLFCNVNVRPSSHIYWGVYTGAERLLYNLTWPASFCR